MSFQQLPLLSDALFYPLTSSNGSSSRKPKPAPKRMFQDACQLLQPSPHLYIKPSDSVLNRKWNDRILGCRKLELMDLPNELILQIFIQLETPICIHQFSMVCSDLSIFFHEHSGFIHKNWLLRHLPRSHIKAGMMSYMAERYRPRKEDEFQYFMENFVLPRDINCCFFDYRAVGAVLTRGKLADDILKIVSSPSSHADADLHLKTVPEKLRAVEALLVMDAAANVLHRDRKRSILLEPKNTAWQSQFWSAFSSHEMLRFVTAASYLRIVFNDLKVKQRCPIWRDYTWRHVPAQIKRGEWLFSQLMGICQMQKMLTQQSLQHSDHSVCLARLFHAGDDLPDISPLMCNAVRARMDKAGNTNEHHLELLREHPEELCWEQWAEMLEIQQDGPAECVAEDCCRSNSVIFTPLWDERRVARRARKLVCPRSLKAQTGAEDYLVDINPYFWA